MVRERRQKPVGITRRLGAKAEASETCELQALLLTPQSLAHL